MSADWNRVLCRNDQLHTEKGAIRVFFFVLFLYCHGVKRKRLRRLQYHKWNSRGKTTWAVFISQPQHKTYRTHLSMCLPQRKKKNRWIVTKKTESPFWQRFKCTSAAHAIQIKMKNRHWFGYTFLTNQQKEEKKRIYDRFNMNIHRRQTTAPYRLCI